MTKGTSAPESSEGEVFPTATVRSDSGALRRFLALPGTGYLWLTAACIVLALVLAVSGLRSRGTVITVRFEQGHGIKAGDALRHRGIEAGEVTSVQPSHDLDRVNVEISLHPAATALAREGSRFWIERPRVSLTRVSGLETVVGAKYVGVQPGPVDGPKAFVFDGLESPLGLFGSDVNIVIRFRDGHGLVVGDAVRYRGIVVGEVTTISLNEELARVEVGVRLLESAQRLARADTQFWIERPKVSLTGVTGLDTLVGGRYIAVWPGAGDAEMATSFEGLDHAPATAQRVEGGLEIVLQGPHRRGIERGAPVTFRGLAIGHILSVGLSSDSIAVQARAYVQPEYRRLVREKTVFWSTSGIDLRFGLTGFQLDAETLTTIAAGGVAMATPDSPGKQVSTGHRFTLHEKPDDQWLAWRPRIPIGSSLLAGDLSLPQPLRATLGWTTKRLGLRRQREHHGWIVALDDQRLLGPADLLTSRTDAAGNDTTLEVAGERISVTPESSTKWNGLAMLRITSHSISNDQLWPVSRLRPLSEPEDCLLVASHQDSHLPVSLEQLTAAPDGWSVDSSMPITEDWHGACVVSLRDGCLVGLVLFDKGKASIAACPAISAERLGKD
jgi:hypothetical protein